MANTFVSILYLYQVSAFDFTRAEKPDVGWTSRFPVTPTQASLLYPGEVRNPLFEQ
jgi:hypothetical protein